MAARNRKIVLTEDWKAKIKASNIIHRLYSHSMGENEMTRTQIDAAKVILAKIIPDLARTEVMGEGGGPVRHAVEMHIVDTNGDKG